VTDRGLRELYIVRQIVSGHQGTISVTSTLDDGTTFIVTLPRAAAPPHASKER
jgi:signal transduction histidine kinase